jgi:hypothetical protein
MATSDMRKLIDMLNENYQAHQLEAEQQLLPAAQLSPVRGMTQVHIDTLSDWMEQSKLGKLVPAKTPGKVLFVPAGDVGDDFEGLEDRVKGLFKALHDRFRMDPFHQHDWLMKTVPA